MIRNGSWPQWLALICITYIFFIPVSKNFILMPALAVLTALALCDLIRSKKLLDIGGLRIGAIWLAFIAFGTIIGVLRAADYISQSLQFLLLWPVAYALISVTISGGFFKPLMWAGMASTLYTGGLVITAALIVDPAGPRQQWLLNLGKPVGLVFDVDDSGMTAVSGYSVSILLWWGSMWLASTLFQSESIMPPRWLRALAGILALSAAVSSSRRAIAIALVATPFFLLFAWLLLRVRNNPNPQPTDRRVAARGLGVFVLTMALGLVVSFMVQPQTLRVVAGGSVAAKVGQVAPFLVPNLADLEAANALAESNVTPELAAANAIDNPSDDISLRKSGGDAIRSAELKSLSTPDSPLTAIVGHGIGAELDRGGLVRNADPWMTELQYSALFFWTGAIGALLILATAVTGARFLRRASRYSLEYFPLLFTTTVGALACLVANASNPYLTVLGQVWPVFLPFAVAIVMRRPHLVQTSQRWGLRFGRVDSATAKAAPVLST